MPSSVIYLSYLLLFLSIILVTDKVITLIYCVIFYVLIDLIVLHFDPIRFVFGAQTFIFILFMFIGFLCDILRATN